MPYKYVNIVKDVRKARGLRQKDLAKATGIKQSEISMIENTATKPCVYKALLIARRLGMSVEKLFWVFKDE